MASLQKHRVKGHTYWRIVESRRVDGKPRPIPVLYLGTADQLLSRLLEADCGRLRLRSFQHGDVAAIKALADRLDVATIIDRHVAGGRRGLSVGTTLLLAAINRAVAPRSKRAFAAWAAGTSIARLFGIEVDGLSSQFFWDQMEVVPEETLEAIESDLTRRVVACFGVSLDTLFYDTTNFFTYIASTNTDSHLANRGHSKQRRDDLRQLSLALLVSREDEIPLCSHTYEGNTVDVVVFPEMLTRIRKRIEAVVGTIEGITLVLDKGNLSKKNLAAIDGSPFHHVTSLVPSQHLALRDIPVAEYTRVDQGPLQGVRVLRLRRDVWGRPRTVVLYVSEQLREGQMRGLQQQMAKSVRALEAWQKNLTKPRSGPRSPESASTHIDEICAAQYVSDVLRVRFDLAKRGAERLEWWIDEAARSHLHEQVFGKRILITDRDDWSTEEIITAYRGQSRVERAFRQLKDPTHLALRPQFHWTDQKIRVHTFICVLALLLARLLERQARHAGHPGSFDDLIERLASVRLAMVLRRPGPEGGRPRCQWQLEDLTPTTAALFRSLVPNQEPFVYTA
jgi:transposase